MEFYGILLGRSHTSLARLTIWDNSVCCIIDLVSMEILYQKNVAFGRFSLLWLKLPMTALYLPEVNISNLLIDLIVLFVFNFNLLYFISIIYKNFFFH